MASDNSKFVTTAAAPSPIKGTAAREASPATRASVGAARESGAAPIADASQPSPSEQLYRSLRSAGIDFVVAVPCKLLADMVEFADADDEIVYTPVSREEEGMGILAGAYMAGRKPAILMQNSGIGNSINAIHSLLNYCEIPVVLVVSHRGSDGEPIEAQRPMGNAVVPLAHAAGISSFEIDDVTQLNTVSEQVEEAFRCKRSVAFLCPFSFWG